MFNLFKSFRFKLTQQILSWGGKNYIFIKSQGNVSFTTVLEARDKKQINVYVIFKSISFKLVALINWEGLFILLIYFFFFHSFTFKIKDIGHEFLLDSKTDNIYDFSKERRDERAERKWRKKGSTCTQKLIQW